MSNTLLPVPRPTSVPALTVTLHWQCLYQYGSFNGTAVEQMNSGGSTGGLGGSTPPPLGLPSEILMYQLIVQSENSQVPQGAPGACCMHVCSMVVCICSEAGSCSRLAPDCEDSPRCTHSLVPAVCICSEARSSDRCS